MGLRTLPYWASWFVTAYLHVALSTLVLLVSGSVCGFAVFTNTNVAVSFLLFFLFGAAMCNVAFFLSTIINRCGALLHRSAAHCVAWRVRLTCTRCAVAV